MITRFEVENYKLLAHVDIPLTPIHVIVGQNDSGKTSLLEAICALCRSASYGPASGKNVSDLFGHPWDGRELVFHGTGGPFVRFVAGIDGAGREMPSVEYGLRLKFPFEKMRIAKVVSEWTRRIPSCDSGLGAEEVDSPQLDPDHTALSIHGEHSHGNIIKTDQELIYDTLDPCDLYRFEPRLMGLPAALDENRKNRMDPDGFGLPTLLDDIVGYDAERFVSLSREFCHFFPAFRKVRIETVQGNSRDYRDPDLYGWMQHALGKGIFFETTDRGTIRAEQASDGAILFLGFLSLLYTPNPPKILLIEEPEKGVYPKRLAEIIGLLKRLINQAGDREVPQIILTTHSPLVLSMFEPEEVTFMSRRGDRAIARPLRDAPHIHERLAGGEFYLGELWYNLEEEELFPDVEAGHRD